MASLRDLDSVGWRFWAASSVILYGPCLYWVWTNVYEEQKSTLVPYVFALIVALILASFLSAIVNTILQKRAERLLAAEKKESKAEKKKAKK